MNDMNEYYKTEYILQNEWLIIEFKFCWQHSRNSMVLSFFLIKK